MTTHTQAEAKSTSTPIPAMQPAHSGLLPQQEQEESDRSLLPSESWQRSPDSPNPIPINPPLVGHNFGSMAIGPMSSPVLQRKLAIGQPGDRYEQEADRVADQVMRMPERSPEEEEELDTVQTKPLAHSISPLVQRQEEEEESEKEAVQAKEVAGQRPTIAPRLETRLQSNQGQGQPLPGDTRAFMERRFGVDFNDVRVHTDTAAVEMNRQLKAQAFTLGRNIYFGAGKSVGNNVLTAHELTHVVQQTQAQVKLFRQSSENEKHLTIHRQAVTGWKGIKKGANAQQVTVGDKGQPVGAQDNGIRRIPLQIDSSKQAIVLIPVKLNPANSIDILLHLHGHNVGYQGTSLDSVRDVQKDQIEQQLLASGHHQMMAILPQGSTSSAFPGVNTTTYVSSVLTALNHLGVWGKNKDETPILVKPEGHNVILSAHSGGGAHLSSLLEQGGKPSKPGGLEGLFLFDAINARAIPKKNPDGSIAKDKNDKPISIPDVNNSTELKRIRAFVAYQLDLELTELEKQTKLANGTPDPDKDQVRQRQLQFLEQNGFRVRGYYTPGWYAQIYAPFVKDIDDWFNKTVATKLPNLDKQVIDRWSKNYVIQSINAVSKVGPVGKGHQGHDYILGQGIPAGKGGKDYDPAKGGALQDALSSIQPKLIVGTLNIAEEQEAERVAEQVMQMPEPARRTPIEHNERIPISDLTMQPQPGSHVQGVIQRQGAPAALTDAQQWDQDWKTYVAQQHYFAGADRPTGTPRHRYDVLCPLYKAHGIPRPMVYMATSITTARFYHFSTPAHTNLATALATAESTLKGKGYATAPVKSVWSLNPRTTSQGGWSNHADGKAVDIDPNENPHLVSQKERKIISLVSGTNLEQGGQGYDVLKGTSEQFKANYNPAGLQKRITELKAVEKGKETERDTIRSDRDALKGKRTTLQAERYGLNKQLKSVPQGKKATPADIAKATALKADIQQKDTELKQVQTEIKQKERDLKQKESELKAATKDRELLEKQLASYQATEKAISDLESAVKLLPSEIQSIEDQITQSQQDEQDAKAAKNPQGIKAQQVLRAKLQQSLKQKKFALKQKQKQLDAKKAEVAADPLRKYAAGGFLNLSKDVVEAMTGAGLRWGGNWAGAKDFMHFELP